jgi:hypothetical protein
MARILILIILFWLLYHVLKRVAAGAKQKYESPAKPDEEIVQCARCGLRIPESESQMQNDQLVCKNSQCTNIPQQ